MNYLFKAVFISLLLVLTPVSVSAKNKLYPVNFTVTELKHFQGHYSTLFGYIFIKARGNQATTTVDSKFIRLVKKSDGRIYPHYKLLGLIPISLGKLSFSLITHGDKRQVVMHSKKHKAKTVGEKFKAVAIPQIWMKRLGRYTTKLVKGKSKINRIHLNTLNDVLVAYINDIKNPYPLLAISATKLYSPSAGHNKSQPISISSHNTELILEYGNNVLRLKKE